MNNAPVLVHTTPSEQKPNGISFSIMLPNGIAAFDVCYNGTINTNTSLLLTEQLLYNLAKLSKSMKIALNTGMFKFDGNDPKTVKNALNSNRYLKNLVNLIWG